MTYLFNAPERFADEAADGFAAAYGRLVRRVPGGVARRAPLAPGTVAVVIGGGSGHYPAFAGYVGEGLAAGAAMGNVFASPSAQHVCSVARAVEAGGGVLFSYGNYAGDALNFGEAATRLAAEGVACASVPVTDDVASAPDGERRRRRGIAGGLIVYKVAGAAAREGSELGEVRRLAELANDRTRSIGVAFSGCTLPGSREPLFDVPRGRMAVGMGVHGESGVAERDAVSADELADLLVEELWRESPPAAKRRGGRVAVVLNGLGSVKYEELFVLYRRVAQVLDAEGVVAVEPEVGELVTSFAMAGVSLSLCWLDDDLERLWLAPALAPALRRSLPAGDFPSAAATGQAQAAGAASLDRAAEPDVAELGPAHVGSRAAAATIAHGLRLAADALGTAAEQLGRYDAIAGDGDHGIGMLRGATAAAKEAARLAGLGSGAGSALEAAGAAWADAGGGTSGALWGLGLRTAGAYLGDAVPPDPAAVADAVDAACAAIARAGDVVEGDKTMLDALAPFCRALREQIARGATVADAWVAAAPIAREAADATCALLPRAGRARLHGERSRGTPDPGAVSLALVVDAAGRAGRGGESG
ncbi:MAG TPA: dihydroxyacetone kinase family protein [Acidimicrobiales bacterium]|nr:dihydroxyacetone kinase family protein [Acidimicrobiales bacterium]